MADTISRRRRNHQPGSIMTTVNIDIKPDLDQMKAWRRQIHQHPELGFEEFSTSQLVADRLRTWGYEVHTGIAVTGVVGVLRRPD